MKGEETMTQNLDKYLDGIFSQYEDAQAIRELKEELKTNLRERWNDLKAQGYDDDTAYKMTVDSIGDISEAIQSVAGKTKELTKMVKRNFSMSELKDSDLAGVSVHDGKFDYSELQGSDFSRSDLTHSSFRCSDLKSVKFDGANLSEAKFTMSSLEGASFVGCTLNGTAFNTSDLKRARFEDMTLEGTNFEGSDLNETSFRNAILRNVSFRHAEVKKTNFDGATMDKLTYAVLKGSGAKLTNVTVI
jgi:uncharacterized protein YjbI with pentapeptide repeats